MTEYLFVQTGGSFAGGATGGTSGETVDLSFPAQTPSNFPTYNWSVDPATSWLADPAIVAAIAGIRVEFTLSADADALEVTFNADNDPDPNYSAAYNFDAGAGSSPFVAAGDVSLTLGDDLYWHFGGALSVAEVLRRAAVVSYPHVYGRISLRTGGPLSVTGFRIVAFTAESAVSTPPPPRRLIPRDDDLAGGARRLIPPPSSLQSSPRRAGGYL